MSTEAAQGASRALLLAALHPGPDVFARRLAGAGDTFDWDWLLDRAHAHKVTALLADRLAAAGHAGAMPAAAHALLSEASQRASERNAKALRDLALVDGCFRRAGIAYLLVKGPVLTQQVYDSPAQRHFFDLDLVVHEAEVDAAQVALEGLGYRLWGGDRYLGFAPASAADLARATRAMRTTLKRFSHELSLVTDDKSLLPIDLHWHLMPPGRIQATAGQLWANTTTASVGGIEVQVLAPEATLLHLAMHAWSNRPWNFALLHLCDVAWALHRLPIDPARLAAMADDWGGRDDLDRALYAVDRALGVRVPPKLQFDPSARPRQRRFHRIATAANLLEHCAHPAPKRWARLQQDLDWGLAMGSLRSTGTLLLAKYAALLRYHTGRVG